MAKEALGKVADCGADKLDLRLVMMYFENWMEKYHLGKFVRLTKDNEALFIRCVNRFMEDYKRELWKKMKLLQYISWDLKLDLTVDPKRFMRLEDELLFIGKAWANLRSWLLKRYGRFEFLCVLEVQKIRAPTSARFDKWFSICFPCRTFGNMAEIRWRLRLGEINRL